MAAALAFAGTWLLAILVAPRAVNGEALYDAATYVRAGRAWLAGAPVYADPDFRQWPLVAVLVAPLAALPDAVALRIWALLSVGGAVAGLWSLWRRGGRDAGTSSSAWLVAVACGPAVLLNAFYGQQTGLLFAAWAAGVILRHRRPVLAGALLGLVAAKPQLALLALPVLVTAPAGASAAFAATLGLWIVLSFVVSGVAGLAAWGVQLTRAGAAQQTVTAVPLASVLPLSPRAHAAAMLVALVVVLVACAALWWRAKRGQKTAEGSVDLATAGTLALVPYALPYDLVFVAPLLLRAGTLAPWRRGTLLAAWWILPAAAMAGHQRGGAWLAAVLPPLAVVVGLPLGRR